MVQSLLPPGWPGQIPSLGESRPLRPRLSGGWAKETTCLLDAGSINLQMQAASKGASLRWVGHVWRSGHLYERPIPYPKPVSGRLTSLPPPLTTAFARRPPALLPSGAALRARPLRPPGALSFAERSRQADSEPRSPSPAACAPRRPGRPASLTCSGEPRASAVCPRPRPLGLPPAPPPPPELDPPGYPAPGPPRPAQVIPGRSRARLLRPRGPPRGRQGRDTGVAAPPRGVLAPLLGPFWDSSCGTRGAQSTGPQRQGQTSPRTKAEKEPCKDTSWV